MRRNLLFLALLMGVANLAIAQQAEQLKNDDVIRLAKAGLSDAVIVTKLESTKCDFDLTADALVSLKKAGVSDTIITKMFEIKKTGESRLETAQPSRKGVLICP